VPLPYSLPPFTALLFAPLALLPLSVAYLAWVVASIGMLVGAVALTARLGGWTRGSTALGVALALVYFPSVAALLLGQVSPLLLLLLALAVGELVGGRWGRAGFWLALGTFK